MIMPQNHPHLLGPFKGDGLNEEEDEKRLEGHTDTAAAVLVRGQILSTCTMLDVGRWLGEQNQNPSGARAGGREDTIPPLPHLSPSLLRARKGLSSLLSPILDLIQDVMSQGWKGATEINPATNKF